MSARMRARGGRIGGVIGYLSWVLSLGLFLTALFLPAARFEVVMPGWMAFVVGYFCTGVFFWPSHLFCVLGWIGLARRDPVKAAIYGACALYGPLVWLWGVGALFPAGWYWLASVLLLVLSGVSLTLLGAHREQPGEG